MKQPMKDGIYSSKYKRKRTASEQILLGLNGKLQRSDWSGIHSILSLRIFIKSLKSKGKARCMTDWTALGLMLREKQQQ